MKLSVIIPCYNAGKTLGEQLAALKAQGFSEPWEVIVADNGSTDDTVSVARRFRKRLPQVRVIRAGGRRGAAHARNCGARVARSEFLAFCDADDVVGEGYLQAVYDGLSRHEFMACRYEFKKLNRRWISHLTENQCTDVDRGLLGPFAYAGGGSLAIRKTVHEAVGGFDEADFPILQDTDYCIRLQRAGVSLVFVPEAVVHYRRRTTVREAFGQARSWGRDVIALRMRHWPMNHPPDTIRSLTRYLLTVRRLRTMDQLACWLWFLGWQVGSIEGWRRHVLNVKKSRPSQIGPRQRMAIRSDAQPKLTALDRMKREIRLGLGKLALKSMSIRESCHNEMLRNSLGRMDPASWLEYPLKIDGAEHIHLAAGARIGSGSWIYAVASYRDQVFTPEIRIGENVRIGRHCHLVATGKITIDRDVVLGHGVYVSDNLHDYRDVHRSIAANKLLNCGEVHIGEGTRIGENVCIVGGIEIGDHCVILSNTVVTRALPPFSVVGGIPARDVKPPNPDVRHWEKSGAGWGLVAPKCLGRKASFF